MKNSHCSETYFIYTPFEKHDNYLESIYYFRQNLDVEVNQVPIHLLKYCVMPDMDYMKNRHKDIIKILFYIIDLYEGYKMTPKEKVILDYDRVFIIFQNRVKIGLVNRKKKDFFPNCSLFDFENYDNVELSTEEIDKAYRKYVKYYPDKWRKIKRFFSFTNSIKY